MLCQSEDFCLEVDLQRPFRNETHTSAAESLVLEHRKETPTGAPLARKRAARKLQ
jgi:hypothetical protein